jgi:hypothetical protein
MRPPRVLVGDRHIRTDVLARLGITGRRIDDLALLHRATMETMEADREDNRRDDAEYRGGR